jgi:S-formylglutathione hydrolase FrmB
MRAAAITALLLASTTGSLAQSTGPEPSAQPRAAVVTRRAVCDVKARPFDAAHIDLTGAWRGNDDGVYYIRQVGSNVFWNGMSDLDGPSDALGRSWNNVAMGPLEGTTLTLQWADVPRSASGGSGELVIEVVADVQGNIQLVTTAGGENFGGHLFRPCTEDGAGSPAMLPPDGTYQAQVSAEDLRAAGAYPGDDRFLAGTATWTFDDGFFSIGSGQLDPETCGGYYRAVGTVVRLTFSSQNCGGMDDFRFVPSGDGSTMSAEFVTCGPQGCNFRTDRALFDRVWTTSTAPAASPKPTIGVAADDGARIVAVDTIDTRTRDLTIESPSVGTVKARLLLPAGFDAESSDTWPVLYLLHGAWGNHEDWTNLTDVNTLTAPTDLLVVMPDAATAWYADAWNDGAGGPPAWETFHTTELLQLIERNWQASDKRVVAGLSMGGFGAMEYAARHPGMFLAAASFSGVMDTTGSQIDNGVATFGDPVAQSDNWKAHNPLDLASKLNGIPLYVSYGDGEPGPLDAAGDSSPDGLEQWIAPQNDAFVARLRELDIPVTVDAYGHGKHDWPYWERALHRSLPMLLEALGEVATGASAPASSSPAP